MNDSFEHPRPVKQVRWSQHVAEWWWFLPDQVRRSVRTFVQAFLGIWTVHLVDSGGLGQLVSADIWSSALMAGVISVVTFVHVSLDATSKGPDTR